MSSLPYQEVCVGSNRARLGKKNDLTGERFGSVLVIQPAETDRHGRAGWFCRCACGTERVFRAENLVRGKTRSCGCTSQTWRTAAGIAHGHTRVGWRSPTYSAWHAMRQRCENPRHIAYPDYGGRGIQVCARWRAFEDFLADMGERPEGLTLDRVKVDGPYEPGNCRWATRAEQSVNQRRRVRNSEVARLLAAARAVVASAGADASIVALSEALSAFDARMAEA